MELNLEDCNIFAPLEYFCPGLIRSPRQSNSPEFNHLSFYYTYFHVQWSNPFNHSPRTARLNYPLLPPSYPDFEGSIRIGLLPVANGRSMCVFRQGFKNRQAAMYIEVKNRLARCDFVSLAWCE
jgi:hypothetical protein